MVGQAWTPSGGGDPGGGAAAGALKVLGAMDLEKGSCRGSATTCARRAKKCVRGCEGKECRWPVATRRRCGRWWLR